LKSYQLFFVSRVEHLDADLSESEIGEKRKQDDITKDLATEKILLHLVANGRSLLP
jgi:hypothetical protein